jgi:hypothetical protein
MKKSLSVILTAFLVSVLFAFMLGGSSASATHEATAEFQADGVRGGPAFYSTFDGTSTGWSAVKGVWNIYLSNYYRSNGVFNAVGSAKHSWTYDNFLYQVRMKRNGSGYLSNNITIRGNPNSLNASNYWKPSYIFQYRNDGDFSVWEITSTGTSIALKNWTNSSKIVKNGWNTLAVRASGSSLKYYINGGLVWSGSDTSLTSGAVGFGFSRDELPGTLLVNWARLTPIILDENSFFNYNGASGF